MADLSGFALLDAADPRERELWLTRWRAWPGREAAAHPDYAGLFARPCDRVLCASLPEVLHPMILRPLAGEPWATGAREWDAVTPYGYGGAFAWGAGSERAALFWDAYDLWAREHRVVSAFARLSLFDDAMLPFRGDIAPVLPNVVVDLTLDQETLWSSYAHKVRKNVNRARESGATVEHDPEAQRLDDFLGIYHATLQRRGAGAGYFFPREFFERARRALSGQLAFFHALHQGRVVSSELVLISAERIYSFLGGTLADAFALRPNDLLKHEIITWGRAAGKRAFVLGGGFERGDGIERYKLSFAPQGEVMFRVGRRILDRDAYTQLVERRRAHEAQCGVIWQPRPNFFPAYRA